MLPLGVTHRPFKEEGSQSLAKTAEELGSVTHNSEISRTGAALAALIIGDLMGGVLPERAVRGALNSVREAQDSKKLIDRMNLAIEYAARSLPDEEVREYFGTGSPVWQTLPLATFYFLKYRGDFRAGVLAAANSYRSDTAEERDRVLNLSWEEQVIEARGGNSDGIAALAGAFLGAYLGYSSIPSELLTVENEEVIRLAGSQLAA